MHLPRSLNPFFAAGLVLSLIGTYLIWQTVHMRSHLTYDVQPLPSATVIDDDRPVPSFHLQRLGGIVDAATLMDRWSLLFFGYTRCPEVCPTELALLKDVTTRLKHMNADVPQVIFVSVDSRRDDVELLANYVREFDSQFVGATGTDADLQPLLKHLGVFVQRNDQSDKRRYSVDHTAAVYLVDPRGRLKAVFEPPQQAVEMANELRELTRG